MHPQSQTTVKKQDTSHVIHDQISPHHRPKRPLRVGFDLDGVLLYNPLRLGRPFVVALKRYVAPKSEKTFHIPRGTVEVAVWRYLHYLSLFTPPGFEKIQTLTDEGVIEPYLVTARYSFLKPELDSFVEKKNLRSYFAGIIYNQHDQQPHLYKEKTIRQLELDFFIEDNWNIVEHLKNTDLKTRVLWMYNFMDRHIAYPHKFARLSDAIDHITSSS